MDPLASILAEQRTTAELPRYAPREDRILVDFCDGFTAELFILDKLQGRKGFVSPEVAEQIKRTHAPTFREQARQDIWVRHVPQHCHCHDDGTPNRSDRKWHTRPSKLRLESSLEESMRHSRQYEIKKERAATQEGAAP